MLENSFIIPFINSFIIPSFYANHLNHKTRNKTTCSRTPSVNPRQQWGQQLKNFGTVAIFFFFFCGGGGRGGHLGLPDLIG